MIIKNEELVLERCLSSVKDFVDEIIIVDTGSTDNSINIAKKFTNNIYPFKWCNDFSKARNYASSLATGDYLMWLDADDIVPPKTAKIIKELKNSLIADVYMLKYDIAFSGTKPTFSYYRERIIKNCTEAFWHGVVHECITPFGKVERLDCSIWHKKEKMGHSNRNLKIYENIIKTRALSPREQYYYGRELYDHKKYKKCIKILECFVNSKEGWEENIIDALYLISICYKNLNNIQKFLNALFSTFIYDTPRANVCCEIGDYFILNKQYRKAIYWYTEATKCKDVTHNGGFVQNIYYNYYPYLQLCCCHYYLGNIEIAKKYNNKAGKYFTSEIIKNNKIFFENINK